MRRYRNCSKYHDSIDPKTLPRSNQEIREILICLDRDAKRYVDSTSVGRTDFTGRFKKSILPKLKAKGLLKNYVDQMDKYMRIEVFKTVSVVSNLEPLLEKIGNDFKWWVEKYSKEKKGKRGEAEDSTLYVVDPLVDALKLCYVDLVHLSMLLSQMFFALEFSCRSICAIGCYRFALKVAKFQVIQHAELWRTLRRLGEKTGVDCEACSVLSKCDFQIDFSALSRVYAYAMKIRQVADYTPRFSSLNIFKSNILRQIPENKSYFESLVEVAEANSGLIRGCLDQQLAMRFSIPRKELYGPFSWDEKSLLSKIKARSDDSQSLYLLGRLYYEKNDLSRARKYLEESVRYNKKNSAAFHLLATICDVEAKTLREERKVWNYLKRAQILDPDNIEILLETGLMLLAFGELDSACRSLERAKAEAIQTTQLCAINTVLSEVYAQMKKSSKSIKAASKAKALSSRYHKELKYWLVGFLNERKKWQGQLYP